MPRIIVERNFEPPLTEQELKETEARMAPCLDLYNVRWIRSYWSADRRRMICEYDAADVASVRNVQRALSSQFTQIPRLVPSASLRRAKVGRRGKRGGGNIGVSSTVNSSQWTTGFDPL